MQTLSKLTRHKLALGCVILVALAGAISTSYRFTSSPPGLKSRAVPRGAATAQILIDSPQSALGNLKQSTAPLSIRAGVFAQFMASNAVRQAIADETGLPASQIVARGPFDDPAAAPNGAAVPDPATGAVGPKPYALTFVAQEQLPLVTVYAQAPTAKAAALLANGAVDGVSSYVTKVQAEGKLPEWQKVVIRRLGPAEAGTVTGKGKMPVMVLAFLALTAIGCFFILLISGARERRREGDWSPDAPETAEAEARTARSGPAVLEDFEEEEEAPRAAIR
jgi:hypothetical protein